MKKITLKKMFIMLAFMIVGSSSFSQVQSSGVYSKILDTNLTKVSDDGDNGDGYTDGALFVDGISSTVGQGAIFTFDGTMVSGVNYAIISNIYNNGASSTSVRVSLYNKTDATELAVYVGAGTFLTGNNPVEQVNFNYTALGTDVGDVLELRYTRNDDGNVSRNFSIDNLSLNGTAAVVRTIIYSEDFLNDTGRGFEKKIIADGGQTAANIYQKISDIPDLVDSNGLYDPATDREVDRIPAGASRNQRALAVNGDNGALINYGINAYAIFTTVDLTTSNTLINPDESYKYASFWTQRRYGNGDIATITIEVSTDYTGDPTTSTWTTLPLLSGKISDTSDNRKYVKGTVDLSTYANGANGNTVTLAMHYVGSSTARTSSNRNGQFWFSDLQFYAQTLPINDTWTGGSITFNDGANWASGTVPYGTHTNVVIPAGLSNYPTAGAAVVLNNVTVESGASFITNSTFTGKVTYKRNLSFTTGNSEGWHLVSSPVIGQNFNDSYVTTNSIASGTTSNRGIATYNNAVASGNWNYLQSGGSGTFGQGSGYSIKTSVTKDVAFTGTLNTTDVAKAITVGAGTAYSLVGNPFTAFINSGTFLTTNTALLDSETIWVWNPSTKVYDAKVSGNSFKVAPGQAFFVKATSAGNVTFETASRSHEAVETFLRSSLRTEIKLNITAGENHRYAKIYYDDNATKGFDNGFDGETFGGIASNFEVFTQLLENNTGKNYQIQSLPNSDFESIIVPVGINAIAGKEITFTADAQNLPIGTNVYLEDRQLNTFTRLDEANANYKVTLANTSNGTGRFYMHTASKALSTDSEIINSVSIYKTSNSNLKVAGLENGASTIKIFNLLGKQVLTKSFSSDNGKQDISLPSLASGVYIVQLQSETGKLNKKIILE